MTRAQRLLSRCINEARLFDWSMKNMLELQKLVPFLDQHLEEEPECLSEKATSEEH